MSGREIFNWVELHTSYKPARKGILGRVNRILIFCFFKASTGRRPAPAGGELFQSIKTLEKLKKR